MGSTELGIKRLVQMETCQACEFKEPGGSVGPTEVACGTHQSGGSGVICWCSRGLQPCLGGCGAHRKNHKNIRKMGLQS